jgi:hypothetical protein
MYMSVCVCTHIYVCVCMFGVTFEAGVPEVCMYMSVRVCMCVYTFMCVCVCLVYLSKQGFLRYVYIHVYVHVHVCTCVRYACMYILC